METIQVVLDTKLRKAADLAAKRLKVNRSALIRRALQEHLKRLRVVEMEERDRWGYETQPQREDEFRLERGPRRGGRGPTRQACDATRGGDSASIIEPVLGSNP